MDHLHDKLPEDTTGLDRSLLNPEPLYGVGDLVHFNLKNCTGRQVSRNGEKYILNTSMEFSAPLQIVSSIWAPESQGHLYRVQADNGDYYDYVSECDLYRDWGEELYQIEQDAEDRAEESGEMYLGVEPELPDDPVECDGCGRVGHDFTVINGKSYCPLCEKDVLN